MKFIYFVIALIISSIESKSLEKRVRSLETNVTDLKHEVDELLIYFKNCNRTANETVFNGFVSNYLHNKTANFNPKNSTNDQSVLDRLKKKLKQLVHINKKERYQRSKEDENDIRNLQPSEVEDLRRNLVKFINCLDYQNSSTRNNEGKKFKFFTIYALYPHGISEIDSNEPTSTVSQRELEEEAERTKVDTQLSFMGHVKHPVEVIGRPKAKPVNLNRIQEQIENAKNAAWMRLDDDDETTTKSNVIFTESSLDFFELPSIKKRHTNLFDGLLEPVKYELPFGSNDETVKSQQEASDATLINNEVNKLTTKIDLKQQMELISFHDQLDEKPKRFDFDVEPYFKLALENITNAAVNKIEEKNDDGIILGAQKFFDFDAKKKKRNLKNKKIEIFYEDHHDKGENYHKLTKKVHEDRINHNEYKFLDETYRLNDGSTHADEIVKPLKIINKLKSPNEVRMDIELGEKYNELENYEDLKEVRKDEATAADAPFYKTENISNESDLEEFSP